MLRAVASWARAPRAMRARVSPARRWRTRIARCTASSAWRDGTGLGREAGEHPAMPREPLTVLIPTYNEERNLPDALASVAGWADEILVVDSFSQDRTVAIAAAAGAR